MNITDLRKKSVKDLNTELNKARGELENLNTALLKGKEKSTVKLRNQRKMIARILTLIKEKESMEESNE